MRFAKLHSIIYVYIYPFIHLYINSLIYLFIYEQAHNTGVSTRVYLWIRTHHIFTKREIWLIGFDYIFVRYVRISEEDLIETGQIIYNLTYTFLNYVSMNTVHIHSICVYMFV